MVQAYGSILVAFVVLIGKPFVSYDSRTQHLKVWYDSSKLLKGVLPLLKHLQSEEKQLGIAIVTQHALTLQRLFSSEKTIAETYTTSAGQTELLMIIFDIISSITTSEKLKDAYALFSVPEFNLPILQYQQTIKDRVIPRGISYVLVPLNAVQQPLVLSPQHFLFASSSEPGKVCFTVIPQKKYDGMSAVDRKNIEKTASFQMTSVVIAKNQHPYFRNHPEYNMQTSILFEQKKPCPVMIGGLEVIIIPSTKLLKEALPIHSELSLTYFPLTEKWFSQPVFLPKDWNVLSQPTITSSCKLSNKKKYPISLYLCPGSYRNLAELQRAFLRLGLLTENFRSIQEGKQHKLFPHHDPSSLLKPIVRRLEHLLQRQSKVLPWLTKVIIWVNEDKVWWGHSRVGASAKRDRDSGSLIITINLPDYLSEIFLSREKDFLGTLLHEITHLYDSTMELGPEQPLYRFKSEGLALFSEKIRLNEPQPVNLINIKEGLTEEEQYMIKDLKKQTMGSAMNAGKFTKVFYEKSYDVMSILFLKWLTVKNYSTSIQIVPLRYQSWKRFLSVFPYERLPAISISRFRESQTTFFYILSDARTKQKLVTHFLEDVSTWAEDIFLEEIEQAYAFFQFPNAQTYHLLSM